MDWDNILDNTLRAFFGIDAVYFAIAALGLNVQFGFAGLLNFGQAAFLACGAYGLGMSTFYFEISLWWGLLFGLVFAVVLGLIMGIPTLRLRADYLAIVTISIAEVVRLFVRSQTFRNVLRRRRRHLRLLRRLPPPQPVRRLAHLRRRPVPERRGDALGAPAAVARPGRRRRCPGRPLAVGRPQPRSELPTGGGRGERGGRLRS